MVGDGPEYGGVDHAGHPVEQSHGTFFQHNATRER